MWHIKIHNAPMLSVLYYWVTTPLQILGFILFKSLMESECPAHGYTPYIIRWMNRPAWFTQCEWTETPNRMRRSLLPKEYPWLRLSMGGSQAISVEWRLQTRPKNHNPKKTFLIQLLKLCLFREKGMPRIMALLKWLLVFSLSYVFVILKETSGPCLLGLKYCR